MKTEIIKTADVTEQEKEELFFLYRRFYANTDYDRFLADFSEKQWLIRMTDSSRLAGFSTQQLILHSAGGKAIRFLFSGDTIVDPEYWNTSHLAGAFGHLFLRILQEDDSALYWFLISKGFRTYRFLPVFFTSFYPAYSGKNIELKQMLDTVAELKFGNCYNQKTELVVFDKEKEHLTGKLAEVPAGRYKDKHVCFFLNRNQNYRRGAELACIAPLMPENLTRCGKRVIEATKVDWHA
jgi:hypothetical protein